MKIREFCYSIFDLFANCSAHIAKPTCEQSFEVHSLQNANGYDLSHNIVLQHHSSALVKFLHNDRGLKGLAIFGIEPQSEFAYSFIEAIVDNA
jgi:hypothetical protein